VTRRNGHALESVVEDVVTHSLVRDVRLPSGRTLALVTLFNGAERPATFGPAGLAEMQLVLAELARRGTAGEVDAVGITGGGKVFAAGADLAVFGELSSAALGEQFARSGHRAFMALADLPVPSFAFVNGLALGGGLELALHATYRTVSMSAGALGLPEVSLGLVPGWGGTFLLPNLIGIEQALNVVVWNPLRQNRTLSPHQALEVGIVDAIFPAVRYLEDALGWADAVLSDAVTVPRPHRPDALNRVEDWPVAIDAAAVRLDTQYGRIPQAPRSAVELLAAAVGGDRESGFAREARAIAALAAGDQFAAGHYARDLVRRRARHPVGAPAPALARPITKIGVIGAGLMARQFALLFLQRLHMPVLITDLDQDRVDAAVTGIHSELDQQHLTGRIDADQLNRLRSLIRGTTDLTQYADCDLVIEAVFEDLSVKHQVLSRVEQVVGPNTVLATNTSSLSIGQIGDALIHPQRLVGIHFFNPVAVMPLIEIVRTPQTSDAAVATAFAVAKTLAKTAVLTADTPGFVVNRLLAVVMGEAARAIDNGTPLLTLEDALIPMCLPMTPIQLMDLVGWKVAAHVLDTMAAAFPERFHTSENLHRLAELPRALERDQSKRITGWSAQAQTCLITGNGSSTREQIRHRVQDGLATEIAIMLRDHVVSDAADIDLCMILGAGWRHLNGGITPYLDRQGVSERVFGDTFHHPPITGSADQTRAQSVTAETL
jgi:3-hydroxyacyl-CoA dehydrogenase/enoyl-CoA hydratase/carnithine racemase